MNDFITVTGAREHNLKNVSVQLPKYQMIVFTGVSGSGKSSLAFDTIFIEGQRKYLESLSSYARQFFGQLKKPDVDKIEGLSPSISIEQKSTSHNPRSTVGTLTEIYDYLRLLYSSIAIPFCPECGERIENQTIDEMVDTIQSRYEGKKIIILAPLIREKKGEFRNVVEQARHDGFLRLRVDGTDFHLDEQLSIDKHKKHTVEIIVDRCVVKPEGRKRLTESVDTALRHGKGTLVLDVEGHSRFFSSHFACPKCDINIPEISPGLFSFNAPLGACEYCKGLGDSLDFDIDKVLPNTMVPFSYWLTHLAIKPMGDLTHELQQYFQKHGLTSNISLNRLGTEHQQAIFHGDRDTVYTGLRQHMRNLYLNTSSGYRRHLLEKFMVEGKCPVCKGKRLKEEVLAMKIGDHDIMELTDKSIIDLLDFINKLKLSAREQEIAHQILLELKSRLSFLLEIGLDYLTLSRGAGTLSGGEAQRLRLATQMGFGLTGVLYVMDEPTIGLHPRDTRRLIEAMKRLRDLGNTLIVVEHDRDVICNADYIVEIGAGAGRNGGHITYSGTKDAFLSGAYMTSKFLSHTESPICRGKDRKPGEEMIRIEGASMHNLKAVTVEFPTRQMICVTGVSGSGKSTLIFDVFYEAIRKVHFGRVHQIIGRETDSFKRICGLESIDKVIVIDQSPIGRTPRSNPATYTGMFDEIRKLFTATKAAKMRGYKPGRFSFNVSGGRCEACNGDGSIKIEMLFLPDVYMPCEVCKGKRYNSQTLEVTYKGHSIADILAMSIDDAVGLFTSIPGITRHLEVLQEVGLGYMTLGQSSTTLSGGEAQRIKLATELSKRSTGKTLYILDEPTTGLHFADVKLLLRVLQTLVDRGNTVLVIEHNTDVIQSADYIIDLGPEGGHLGGQLVAQGNLEAIRRAERSYTGKYL